MVQKSSYKAGIYGEASSVRRCLLTRRRRTVMSKIVPAKVPYDAMVWFRLTRERGNDQPSLWVCAKLEMDRRALCQQKKEHVRGR
jgi:hypothetical protein